MNRNLVVAVLAGIALLASDAFASPARGGGGGGGGGGARGGGGGGAVGRGGGGGVSRGGGFSGGGRSVSAPSRSGGGYSGRSGGGSSFRGGSSGAASRSGGYSSRSGGGSAFRNGGGSGARTNRSGGLSPRSSTRSGGSSFRSGGDYSRGQGVSSRGQASRYSSSRSGLPARNTSTDATRPGRRIGSSGGQPVSRSAGRTGFVLSDSGRRGSFLKNDPASNGAHTNRTGFQPLDRGNGGGPRDGRGNGNEDDNGPGSGQGAGHDDGLHRGPGHGRGGRDGGGDAGGGGNGGGNGGGQAGGGGNDGGLGRGGRGGFIRNPRTGTGGATGRNGTGGVVDQRTYREGWRNGYRVGTNSTTNGTNCGTTNSNWSSNCNPCGSYHGWYDNSHWYLSFSFGYGCGSYVGFNYYYPYHSWNYGCDYAFFYPQPVSWCYAPYGFYWDSEPIYVTRYEVVRETVPQYEYERRETVPVEQASTEGVAAGPAGEPAEEIKVAEPKPAAGSPATEKLLREGSAEFHEAKYYEAAVKFRLAALSSPDMAGPYFALGQSLVSLGHDEYAAKVLRKAILIDPKLMDETGDVTGVFKNNEEFDRVLAALETRAAAAPADGDARFLLAMERYFTGDARCREDFRAYCAARSGDPAASLLKTAVEVRFKALDELPELTAPAK